MAQADTLMSFVGTVHSKRVSEPTHISHTAPRTTHYTNTCMSLEKQALGALLLAGQRSHVIAGQPAIPPMGASLLPGPVAPRGKPLSISLLLSLPLSVASSSLGAKTRLQGVAGKARTRRGRGTADTAPTRRERQGAADDKRLLAP